MILADKQPYSHFRKNERLSPFHFLSSGIYKRFQRMVQRQRIHVADKQVATHAEGMRTDPASLSTRTLLASRR